MAQRITTTHLVVHTTASALVEASRQAIPERYRDQAEPIAGGGWVVTLDPSAADIDRMHRKLGWRKIGYHWVIRKDGTLESGREEHEVGSHCRDGGMNRKAIGVTFSGHHNYEGWTAEQRATWLDLAVRIVREHDIPVAHVIGHREAGARKDCPGTAIDMDVVRAELARRLRDEPDGRRASPDSLLGLGSHGPRVGALQRRLAVLGYDVGRDDEDFGPRTTRALRAAQTRLGLIPDGVAGPTTAGALGLSWPSLGAR